MLRRMAILALALALIAPIGPLTHAQGGDASTAYQLNMRTGPGTGFAVIVTLPAGTALTLEARNADTSWLLAHTLDGAQRGWVASLYLKYAPGVSAALLPISEEIIGGAAPTAPEAAAPAPGGLTAAPRYQMNVRAGPGTGHSVLGQVRPGTVLIPEARNGDASWVLAHTQDGALRGWLASLYLKFSGGSALSLPLSEEILPAGAGAAPAAPAAEASYAGIPLGGLDLSTVAGIDLTAYPVVGRATGRARQIFLDGRARGNNPHVVAKVGDCSSEHWYFLKPFAWGEYNLGSYGYLQAVINHFGESLAYDSEATHNGFNANAVIAPEWANPAVCQPGESPLECEFRIHRPSVAIIMFGTSDLLVMTPGEFDHYMREMVDMTIEAGVIPILSTFPGNLGFWDRTILYNQIVVRIALDYNIPLINLWLALESLPNHGLEPDGFHLGEPPYGTSGYLTAPYLSAGYTMRNLVTLQTLDAVWRGAMY